MKIQQKLEKILQKPVCDNCLGRQFSKLLSGFSNEQRGKILRKYAAFLLDAGEIDVDSSNFYDIKFYSRKIKPKKPKKCYLCGDLFPELKKKAKQIEKELKKYEYKTFLIGSRPKTNLLKKEEELWEKIGIDYCEPLRGEINRELGKLVEKLTKKHMDYKPDITIFVDFNKDKIQLSIRSLYIYGKYQKLKRGIPQTKWKKKIFKTSVQEEIARPILKVIKSKDSSFHGAGREDIDARCLGWRPFVIEILNPLKRKINIRKIQKKINKSKKVQVKGLKLVKKSIVRDVKSAMHDKVYRITVAFENPIENLKEVKKLKNTVILQQTPKRVLRRRSDKLRKRKVIDIKYKLLSKKKVEFTITAQAGLYIKELVTGDDSRTQPNISDMINNKVKNMKLDVIRIKT